MNSTQSLVALASVLMLLGAGTANSLGTGAESRFVEGQLLVKFRGGPGGEAAWQAKATLQHEVKRGFRHVGWQQITLPRGTTVEAALPRYTRHPGVIAVEPNYILEQVTASVPDDLRFPQQYALQRIAAPAAWDVSTGGSNVVVAVIDSGINYRHQDLRENMWVNSGEVPGNGIDDDGNGFSDDVHGIDAVDEDSDPLDVNTRDVGYHGTAVAGIIGAAGNNGIGIAGVNWSVRLMALRITNTNNTENVADQLQALNYVLLMKRRGVNIRALNLSYGSTTFSQAAKDAHDLVAAEGIVQVAAAGNASRDIDGGPLYPAGYATSNLIAVTASTATDELAYFSNFGRNHVELAAPGVLVLTTDGSGTNGYVPFAGTSAAVPHVVGAASLIAAAYPTLPATRITAAIRTSWWRMPRARAKSFIATRAARISQG